MKTWHLANSVIPESSWTGRVYTAKTLIRFHMLLLGKQEIQIIPSLGLLWTTTYPPHSFLVFLNYNLILVLPWLSYFQGSLSYIRAPLNRIQDSPRPSSCLFLQSQVPSFQVSSQSHKILFYISAFVCIFLFRCLTTWWTHTIQRCDQGLFWVRAMRGQFPWSNMCMKPSGNVRFLLMMLPYASHSPRLLQISLFVGN